jgi:hypothetical protein
MRKDILEEKEISRSVQSPTGPSYKTFAKELEECLNAEVLLKEAGSALPSR